MWKAQAGVKVAAPQTGGDDDDWETDADFVVGNTFLPMRLYNIFHVLEFLLCYYIRKTCL